MTVKLDLDELISDLTEKWEWLTKVDKFFHNNDAKRFSAVDNPDLARGHHDNTFKELFYDDRMISYAVAFILKQLKAFVKGENRDIVAWTKKAQLKKNGTFHRTYIQYYSIDGKPATYEDFYSDKCRLGGYRCKCIADTEYQVGAHLLFGEVHESHISRALWLDNLKSL